MRRSPFLAVLAVALPVAVGCSHDLSFDDWLRQADARCGQAQASVDQAAATQTPLPGDSLRRLADQSRQELDALRELPIPDEKRSSVAEYLITLDHRIETLGNYADALDKAPAQGPAPDRSRLEDITTEGYNEAVALGLERCGGGVDIGVGGTTTSTLPAGANPDPTLAPQTAGSEPDQDFGAIDGPG